ncbi:uncharacterized protein LOC132544176 [Ylistrum balloti]|uniref:uncharacterized protein LOC132544176 n=1 Tax=Ylistrum balloti TaxID=509963 RepID=UPI002905B1F9|nr:uncharacterized protein LOC132544176 [Ylistrum balloti]
MEFPEQVLNYHTDMIYHLGQLFAIPSPEWNDICRSSVSNNYISTNKMGRVTSMSDLCSSLMDDVIIEYGKYDRLKSMLGRHKDKANEIIDKYTELIRKEMTGGKETNDQQMKYNFRSASVGNRQPGQNSDIESRNGTGNNSNTRRRKSSDKSDLRPSEKRMKVEGEGSHQFRKNMDNTHDARILDVWMRARNAVGHIKGPRKSGGTGFRVGKNYIMTAYHVAEDLTKRYKSDDEDWSKLDSREVSIEFQFPEDNVKKFHFEPDLIYGLKEQDIAILQLKDNSEPFPDPIRRFGKIDYHESFALLGFPCKPNNEIMQFDSDIKLFNLDSDAKEDRVRREKMLKDDIVQDGYEGIDNKEKVLFDCWVQHGASGSPGIVMSEDVEPVCTLMLIRGYPTYAFSGNISVPYEEMIEQGVKMEAIANLLGRGGKRYKELRNEIFGDSFMVN